MRRTLAVALAVAPVAACSFPTDKSADIYVTIETPALALVNGDQMSVRAHAWRLVGGVPDTGTVDDVELGNVDFSWTTADDQIAIVEKDCCGYATVTGLDPGLVDITARAMAFEKAPDATLPLRVSNFIEIDSLTPTFAKWGGKITLWGVGVQFATFPRLSGERLLPDTLSFASALGLSHMDFWVPAPAQTGFVVVQGPGFFFPIPQVVFVDTEDVYEPNDTIGTPVNLDAAPPYPQAPSILLLNPALAFEPIGPGWPSYYRYDYYRFTRADTTQALTYILRPEHVTDTSQLYVFLTDSLDQSGGDYFIPGGGETWLISPGYGLYGCNFEFVFLDMAPSESTIVAFKTLPSQVIQNVNFYHDPGNYAMSVHAGYLRADPRIGPDRFEENDVWCKGADQAFARGDSIVISRTRAPFTDTLTIDNPHDVDWLRFRVLGAAPDTVAIFTVPRLFPGDIDRSDIDLYVFDASPNPVNLEGSIESFGSSEGLLIVLAPGDYYLAVVDFPGRETRYGICMTVGTNQPCVPPGAATTGAAALRAPAVPRPKHAPRLLPSTLLRGRSPSRRP